MAKIFPKLICRLNNQFSLTDGKDGDLTYKGIKVQCKCQATKTKPNDQSLLHMTLQNRNNINKMKSSIDKILIYGFCRNPIRNNSLEIFMIGWIKFKDFGVDNNGNLNITMQKRGNGEPIKMVTDVASKFIPFGTLASSNNINS